MRHGKIKWFDSQKGFGYITEDNTGIDIFVHMRNIESTGCEKIDNARDVEFDIAKTNKGMNAVHVIIK